MSGNNGESRLDRIEATMEGLVDAHMWLEKSQKDLLRSQILLTDVQERTEKKLLELAGQMVASKRETDEALKALALSGQRRDGALERMDDALVALMGTVDEIIRSRKQ
jgi:hypothetical protein